MKIKIERDGIYTTTMLSIIFGVSDQTIRQWSKNGKLKGEQTYIHGFVMEGYDLLKVLREKQMTERYECDYFVGIPDELKLEYLSAVRSKCVREMSLAEQTITRCRRELDEIIRNVLE